MFRRDPSRTLGERLVKLRLISAAQLDEAKQAATDKSPTALIAALEKKQFVTPYQAGKLRANEFDALVLGDYRLTYQNAAGSFARVFRAESLSTGRVVALKLLRSRHAGDAKEVAGFFREARLVQKLRHKNIVPIYDLGSEGDSHFFTMEFVEGGNLRDFLAVRKKLSPSEATRYTLDVAEGLEVALASGVTHRDLKLSNVLITTTGIAKLVDFGLAGEDTPNGGGADQRAVEYATLEKATNVPHDDPRSDLFFLGAIYYELLTGTPPWPYTRSRDERKQVARYRDVTAVDRLEPSLPPRVVGIVEKLMTWDPAQRYQTPGEAVADLTAVLKELGEPAKPGALPGPDVADDPPPKSTDKPAPSVLFVESRPKRQDVLRDYLGKRGFRPMFLSEPSRAVARLDRNPPDAVVFMGEILGDDLFDLYPKVLGLTQELALVAVFVLSEAQSPRRGEFEETATCRIITQPLILRELRKQLQLGLKEVLTQSRLIKLPPIPETG